MIRTKGCVSSSTSRVSQSRGGAVLQKRLSLLYALRPHEIVARELPARPHDVGIDEPIAIVGGPAEGVRERAAEEVHHELRRVEPGHRGAESPPRASGMNRQATPPSVPE